MRQGRARRRRSIGRLIEGTWYREDEFPTDESGSFVRVTSTFRDFVSTDPAAQYPVQAGRYHLYVSHACPWAHRVLIARERLGLQEALGITVAEPHMGQEGWTFTDGEHPCLWRVYVEADPQVSGRATVPVLWDRQTRRIVNNESREILRMMCTEMSALHRAGAPSLSPEELRPQIDHTIDAIYEPINNGVYRAGFARSQAAHEEAVRELFVALDHWERVLARQRWLCGDRFTEADICLFTTLLRFDSVYVTHFKCNLRRLVEYPNLWAFTRDVHQQPGVASTVHMDHIKAHYFTSHPTVNPRGLVPLGPMLDFDAPHDRAGLSARATLRGEG